MRLLLPAFILVASLGCYIGTVSERQTEDEIVHACVWSTSQDTPHVEVAFASTINLECQTNLNASCTVTLEGNTLVVQGEASWRDTSRFCGSANWTIGASCVLPQGWETATTLDWGTGATEPVPPPIVGLGQGANAGCELGCRVGEGGEICD
jgi:hypothetical protein